MPEIGVRDLCAEMVAADLDVAKQTALLKSLGYHTLVTAEG